MFLTPSSSTLADTLVGPLCFELAPDCLGGDGLDDEDLRDLDFDLRLSRDLDLERRRWDFFFDSLFLDDLSLEADLDLRLLLFLLLSFFDFLLLLPPDEDDLEDDLDLERGIFRPKL